MPEPLKNIYNKVFIDELTTALKIVYPAFDTSRFTKMVFDKDWAEKELKQRMRHIALCLGATLPEKFDDAVSVILRCIDELRKKRKGEMYFEFMFFPDFIEIYGIENQDASIKAMEEITKFSSAEFAIRPFLIKYPAKFQKQLLIWSKHPHAMVRRLASEGFRPRLPWAMAVPYLKKDPSVILPVLENLKQDDSETVRRSVANNLNDIAKDHPEVVIQIAAKWQGKSMETDKLIRHACRSLLKRGNAKALQHFGLGEVKGVTVSELKLAKKKINMGSELRFSFSLELKKEAKLRLEYGIDYMKSNGKTNRKIFKISEGVFEKGTHTVSSKQVFKDFTTRKHYAGKHGIAIILNGKEVMSDGFLLVM